MKRLIAINILLILIIYLIPLKEKDVENIIIEQNDIIETVNEPEIAITVTSRHGSYNNQTKSKNLTLNVNSDLRQTSNLTAEEFDKILSGTELEGIGDALEEVEIKHNLNGLYFLGLACLESGYGSSKYARERNNLVGWNAVDSNPNKATYFKSKDECISYVAAKLKSNYLTENGCYFEGYTARDIDKHYCTDKKHADKIIQVVDKLIKKL